MTTQVARPALPVGVLPPPPAVEPLTLQDLEEAWLALSPDERREGFTLLSREDAEELFGDLSTRDQAQLIRRLPEREARLWMRHLAPDDAADVVQEAEEEEERARLVSLLDPASRREVQALLAYEEDVAGGLMSPRFARVRPDMTADEALSYLRRQARGKVETVYYAYVLDAGQHLLGVASFRELFAASPEALVRDVMERDVEVVAEGMDQESVSRLFVERGLLAMPVIDADGRMKGVITVDDIVDVVEEEATEDIQKVGGTEALDQPYVEAGFKERVSKRAGWLTVLFLGQMLTTTAMSAFQDQIASALVLALFLPLIISSGGNTGSQACTLIIRSLALGEVRLSDWWRVFRRELVTGLALGLLLGVIGFVRVVAWDAVSPTYGPHAALIGVTIGLSLVGVVLWGSLAGAMLPFLLRRLGADPASASAPFVATLIDVTGVVLYFSVASAVLSGSLL